jgi:tRNA uridine 5-carboxymethylaminomethyl modification enzyme
LRKAVPFVETFLASYSKETIDLAVTDIKYAGYIEKEKDMVDKMNRLEEMILHDSLDYGKIQSLSLEAREKLTSMRPRTLGQASRISGVSPSDISVLLVHVGR